MDGRDGLCESLYVYLFQCMVFAVFVSEQAVGGDFPGELCLVRCGMCAMREVTV
jgi:hypothetical protein